MGFVDLGDACQLLFAVIFLSLFYHFDLVSWNAGSSLDWLSSFITYQAMEGGMYNVSDCVDLKNHLCH